MASALTGTVPAGPGHTEHRVCTTFNSATGQCAPRVNPRGQRLPEPRPRYVNAAPPAFVARGDTRTPAQIATQTAIEATALIDQTMALPTSSHSALVSMR